MGVKICSAFPCNADETAQSIICYMLPCIDSLPDLWMFVYLTVVHQDH